MNHVQDAGRLFLAGAIDSFRSHKCWADDAIAQLADEPLRRRLNSRTNSIAMIMKHVAGNLRSRWTDFLTSDGEKPDRDRDQEFVEDERSRAELLADWESGWDCLFTALAALPDDCWTREVVIRGHRLPVPAAIERSLAHCAYHVGQILLLGPILAGDAWRTLTIQPGQSATYNQQTWGSHSPAPPLMVAAEAVGRVGPGSAHPSELSYQLEPGLSVDQFIDVLRRSTLAERRPIDEADTLRRMLRNADVIVTARDRGQVIGVARAITDFGYCTYLSDLAVDVAYQRRGVGRELIQRTHEAAGRQTTLILLAAPAARTYYPHIGMTPHESCWVTWRQPPQS